MDHPAIQGVQRSAHEHTLPHEVLNADEIRRRWPAFKCHDADIGIHEKDAGFLLPERCIAAHLQLADRCGADLRHNVRVQSWRSDGANAVIQTDAGAFECKHLILTAGPWLPELLADLRLPLRVERQVQLWFEPRDPARFTPERMPIFIHFVEDRAYYGIPIAPGETPGHACSGLLGGGCPPAYDRAVKIARHHGGLTTTAASVDRSVNAQDEADVRDYLRRYIPEADGPLVASKVCLYTNTPDDHFIIDRHPRHENVLIAGGFSGHGFKFAPLVGEMMADMVTTGRSQHPIDFFSIARFTAPR
jgi:sarcosine oxidase